MGDILGGVFGGGEQKEQETKPTAEARQANKLKLAELRRIYGSGVSLADFTGKQRQNYTVSRDTQRLIDKATNPSNMMSLDEYLKRGTDAGKGYMSKIASPEIMAQLSLQGMERSGAAPEALAKASAGMALPFLGSIPSFMTGSAQQAQTLAGLNDMPRQLRVEDSMRRQGLMTTAFTGIPFSPGSQTQGGTSSLPLFNMFGMGGSL